MERRRDIQEMISLLNMPNRNAIKACNPGEKSIKVGERGSGHG